MIGRLTYEAIGFLAWLYVFCSDVYRFANHTQLPEEVYHNNQIRHVGPAQVDKSRYIQLIPSTILSAIYGYDYLLTFSMEVETVWNRKFSGATVVFLLSRYGTFTTLVVNIMEVLQ